MEENKNTNQSTPQSVASVASDHLSPIKMVERVTVWVMVISTIVFALICIAAIWGLFGDNQDNIIGRSLGTIAVIAFAALIVNVGANILDHSKKK